MYSDAKLFTDHVQAAVEPGESSVFDSLAERFVMGGQAFDDTVYPIVVKLLLVEPHSGAGQQCRCEYSCYSGEVDPPKKSDASTSFGSRRAPSGRFCGP